MYDQSLIENAIKSHCQQYGAPPAVVSYAPGRIEILGNHTDYNLGTTLSTAINLGVCFCISGSNAPGVHLSAIDLNETVSFDPSNDERLGREAQWANYVKGVMFYLRDHDICVDGVDCSFAGSIPMGAGLSSSAALEVATAFAVIEYVGAKLGLKDVGILAQKSENNFAGCNCGLLDQFSSIFGVEQGLIHSDFRTLETSSVPLPSDVRFLMINPHIKHALADSPYNERRVSCERAAKQLGDLLDHPVESLRDVSLKEFNTFRDLVDPEAAQRAEHVVNEIYRVETGVEFLAQNKLSEFGQFLFDSHETSRVAFENSCPELDLVVEAAQEAKALGARLSGGGWGGSVVALVLADDAEFICQQIIDTCMAKGLAPTAEIITPSAGAMVMSSAEIQRILKEA